MICLSGQAEGDAVYKIVNKSPDNNARQAKGGSLMCRPFDGADVYAIFIHFPQRRQIAQLVYL